MEADIQNPQKNYRVFIVDDSEISREAIHIAFQEAGINVIAEASNGLDALKKLEQIECEFISIDIIMPEMDGIELYFEIQKKFPKLNAFFISVLSQDRNFISAMQSQIPEWKFLKKPVSADAILQCIHRFSSALESKS